MAKAATRCDFCGKAVALGGWFRLLVTTMAWRNATKNTSPIAAIINTCMRSNGRAASVVLAIAHSTSNINLLELSTPQTSPELSSEWHQNFCLSSEYYAAKRLDLYELLVWKCITVNTTVQYSRLGDGVPGTSVVIKVCVNSSLSNGVVYIAVMTVRTEVGRSARRNICRNIRRL